MRSPALRILVLAAGAALASSCALVLGFEDHEPYPSSSSTGALGGGGATSSSSSASTGGGGATSSSSGTGGSLPSAHFGAPEILASGQVGPSDLSLDGTTVFWINAGLAGGQGQIMKVAKAGGDPAQIAYAQFTMHGLENTPTSVWCVEKNSNSADSYIAGFGKGGNTNFANQLYVLPGGTYHTMALQGTVIAWASNESSGSVFRGDTQGGAKATLAMSQGVVGGIALDGNTTYWVSPQQGAVMRSVGGTVDVFASGENSPTAIALDADSVYWTGNDGSVKKLAKASAGSQPTVIVSDALSPQGIALDETNVYWAEADGANGRVRTAPKGGGKAETIAMGQYPFDVAVDASAVYATMQGDGNIIKIPKK